MRSTDNTKKYLLTWYGITDFRASLGFESSEGPIVNALKSGSYTDVVVLCYTQADSQSQESTALQKRFKDELSAIHKNGKNADWGITSEFVSKFANTEEAHKHFVDWLKAKTVAGQDRLNIWFKSEKLKKLNDTEGIYACAMRALDLVAKGKEEKFVSLYLSPGTPTMAFVWAFAALAHPELKKRLIASSVIGAAPEVIGLPAEWLERHGAKRIVKQEDSIEFDIVFHLFGEQRMPALLGIRQFSSKKHVFVNSKNFPAASMRRFTDAEGSEFAELSVNPWDPIEVRERILKYMGDTGQNRRVGFNLTGGTKLMYAGALAASRALGAVPFYFDSGNRNVIFLENFEKEPIKEFSSVSDFFLLNGDGLNVSENSHAVRGPESNRALTESLWKDRNKMASHYKQLRQWNQAFTPFTYPAAGYTFSLDKSKVAVIEGKGLNLKVENWPEFAKYLCGCWLEEYVYLLLKRYEDEGVIKDLRINVEIDLTEEVGNRKGRWKTYNELDLVFTDGHSLYIVECKAGNVTQDNVMKLQNLVRVYGGVGGRGLLACCFPPNNEPVRKKIEDAKLILCCGKSLPQQIEELMQQIKMRANLA